MSDDPARLSLKLCEVLERVGVSESMRKMHHETNITLELVYTLGYGMDGLEGSAYIFGSTCEGTTTPEMGSDFDIVQCIEYLSVIEDIKRAPRGESLLIVTDTHTRPGYVKLQEVKDGIPLTRHNHRITVLDLSYDCYGRVCRKHTSSTMNFFNERNGPADTVSNNPDTVPVDLIKAFRCRTYPQIASDSIEKCISCGWVSREEVESMKRLGILLVGTGHPASEERAIEWRMSFSLQERQLMQALNPIQHKCYVTLKLLKNIVTAGLSVKNALTSYHCKTCLFSVITDTDRTMWIDGNLIKCVFSCLTKLIHWVSRGYCPNFFIEQSNMFERREFMEVQERLLRRLQDLVSQGPSLFYRMKSDDIGEELQGRAIRKIEDRCAQQSYVLLVRSCGHIIELLKEVLLQCLKLKSSQDITRFFFGKLCYLRLIHPITEHTHEQTQGAAQLLMPIIHKLYAQQLASVAFSIKNPASRHQHLQNSARHLTQGLKCDRISASLLEAAILYRCGQLESCRGLLEQIERSKLHSAVISMCMCYPSRLAINEYLKGRISTGNINLQNIMELAVAPCMMFLPSQSEIIPKALQYEMFRSVAASPDTKDEYYSQWYDLTVVDSKIYLFFLQYLVYSDLNQPVAKRIAIDQIWNKLLDPNDNCIDASNLGHRETACNLLGWIYIQEGQIPEALVCFIQSWRIRPDHNAAKWHVLELYRRMHVDKSIT